MGPNRRAQEYERTAARDAAEAKRAEAERKAIADAQKIVAIWNARLAGERALWSTRRSAPQALAGAERWMLDQREIWEQRLDRIQDYVEGLATNKEKP